jgi:hypothetical protein
MFGDLFDVKFFYTRLGYLRQRYEELYQECVERGINVQYYGNAWDNVPKHLMGDYTSREEDKRIIKERIAERLGK